MQSRGLQVQPDDVGKTAVYIAARASDFKAAVAELIPAGTVEFKYSGDSKLDSDITQALTKTLLSVAGAGMWLEHRADMLAAASTSYAGVEDDINFLMERTQSVDPQVRRSAQGIADQLQQEYNADKNYNPG